MIWSITSKVSQGKWNVYQKNLGRTQIKGRSALYSEMQAIRQILILINDNFKKL